MCMKFGGVTPTSSSSLNDIRAMTTAPAALFRVPDLVTKRPMVLSSRLDSNRRVRCR